MEQEPATKADLAALEAKMDAGFAAVDEKLEMLRAEGNHRYDDLKETLRDSETKLLQAFYNFALTNNKRHAQTEVNEVALRSRMDTIEQRLLEVEHRLNIPPAA